MCITLFLADLLPLGMQSNIIADDQLKQSLGTGKEVARLFIPGNGLRALRSQQMYLQIDFGSLKTITAVAIQGGFRTTDIVTKYTLQSSNDGMTFIQEDQVINFLSFLSTI